MEPEAPILVVLLGPTADGKSRVAVDLALRFGGEVIGGDSMQVYRGFDIGTDKPDPQARRGVPHHLIDSVSPEVQYTAADFVRDALSAARGIAARGRLPILAGGTGLYIRALLDGLFPGPGRDPAIRASLEAEAQGLAHQAARPVRPDDIFRCEEFTPLGPFDRDAHALGILRQSHHAGAEADFGIALSESAPTNMVCHDLFETGQKLIALKGHHFFSGKTPTLKQIAEAPLILFSRTGTIEPFIEMSFAKERLTPNVVMTHNNFSSMKRYVNLGVGVALLSDYAVSAEDEKTMDVLSLDTYFPKRKVGLLLRKRKYHSPAVQAFLRTLVPDIQFTK